MPTTTRSPLDPVKLWRRQPVNEHKQRLASTFAAAQNRWEAQALDEDPARLSQDPPTF